MVTRVQCIVYASLRVRTVGSGLHLPKPYIRTTTSYHYFYIFEVAYTAVGYSIISLLKKLASHRKALDSPLTCV